MKDYLWKRGPGNETVKSVARLQQFMYLEGNKKTMKLDGRHFYFTLKLTLSALFQADIIIEAFQFSEPLRLFFFTLINFFKKYFINSFKLVDTIERNI